MNSSSEKPMNVEKRGRVSLSDVGKEVQHVHGLVIRLQSLRERARNTQGEDKAFIWRVGLGELSDDFSKVDIGNLPPSIGGEFLRLADYIRHHTTVGDDFVKHVEEFTEEASHRVARKIFHWFSAEEHTEQHATEPTPRGFKTSDRSPLLRSYRSEALIAFFLFVVVALFVIWRTGLGLTMSDDFSLFQIYFGFSFIVVLLVSAIVFRDLQMVLRDRSR